MTTLLTTTLFLLGANFYDESFQKANAAYENRDYATAAQLYEQLVAEDVVNAAVFYNLGNAYYRQGMLGPAIANYERALQLEPGMESARRNLAQSVRQTQMRMERPLPPVWEQSLLFWHFGIPSWLTMTLAIVFWLVFWAALGVRQFRRIRYLRLAATVACVLAVAFGASAWAKAHPTPLAVAGRPEVPVYHGTSTEETVRFKLKEGDRVTVDRRERGWARVTTPDGEWGWTPEEGLAFVGPPYERFTPAPAAPTPKEAP